MSVLSIKVPIRKKSGNLFNDPRIYIYKTDENKQSLQKRLINKKVLKCWSVIERNRQ